MDVISRDNSCFVFNYYFEIILFLYSILFPFHYLKPLSACGTALETKSIISLYWRSTRSPKCFNLLYSICTGEALWRKVISAACICNLILSFSSQSSRPEVRIGMKIDDSTEGLALRLSPLPSWLNADLLYRVVSLLIPVFILNVQQFTLGKDMRTAQGKST